MTVQGPVKKQQPDGMSHRVGGIGGWVFASSAAFVYPILSHVVVVEGVPITPFYFRSLLYNFWCWCWTTWADFFELGFWG